MNSKLNLTKVVNEHNMIVTISDNNDKATRIIDLYRIGLTQEEIGRTIGISQVQVSRILKNIGYVIKYNIKGGMAVRKQKITEEQLLAECMEHGTGKEACEIIAAKYGMMSGSIYGNIRKYRIEEKLRKKRIQGELEKEKAQLSESIATIQPEQKKVSTLKPKAWGGKENTYSFQDGKLIITNKEGTLPVEDIKAIIQELQELAEKEAV